jgi:hypothetical protein
LVARETSAPPQSLSVPARQALLPKSRVTEEELAYRYRYVLSDLKRWIVIAPALFLLLIILYFIFR